MSFLNPVNEAVQRFKSTDAGAPQINYAARTAGDIKTVLKWGLVKAGWSVVNEVDHVCEFVSPSVAMIDYELKVDDSSASSTIWTYKKQNTAYALKMNNLRKNMQFVDASNAKTGWQLLVTSQGFYFVETFYIAKIANTLSRVTYFGRLKQTTGVDDNIAFFCVGWGQFDSITPYFFDPKQARFFTNFIIEGKTQTVQYFDAINITAISNDGSMQPNSIDVISPIYISTTASQLAQQPGMYIQNTPATRYGIHDITVGGKKMIRVAICSESLDYIDSRTRYILLSTDFAEY